MKYKGPKSLNLVKDKNVRTQDAQKEKYKDKYAWGFYGAPEFRVPHFQNWEMQIAS